MAEELQDLHPETSATVAQECKHRNRAPKVFLLAIAAWFFWHLISASIPHGDSFPLLSRARTDIKTAELAVNRILSDAAVPRLRDLFNNPDTLDAATNEETIERHTAAMYLLLKEGKRAALDLRPDIRARLSDMYMDIGKDPWQENLYIFPEERCSDAARATDLHSRPGSRWSPGCAGTGLAGPRRGCR